MDTITITEAPMDVAAKADTIRSLDESGQGELADQLREWLDSEGLLMNDAGWNWVDGVSDETGEPIRFEWRTWAWQGEDGVHVEWLARYADGRVETIARTVA